MRNWLKVCYYGGGGIMFMSAHLYEGLRKDFCVLLWLFFIAGIWRLVTWMHVAFGSP